jgi:rapamycin-insensitive companion of mTOR
LTNRIADPEGQSLPRLFALASGFDDSVARLAATSALHSVDSINRKLTRSEPTNPAPDSRSRSGSLEDPLRRGQRQIENAKIRIGMQIDDTSFRNQLIESGVLSSKDHTKWNFETLTVLLEGPLLSPKRLEEATRGSKFIRRVVHFFYPFNYKYSDMSNTKVSYRMRLGSPFSNTEMGPRN